MKAGGGEGQAAPEEGSCLHRFFRLVYEWSSICAALVLSEWTNLSERQTRAYYTLHTEASINLYPVRQAGAPQTAHSHAAKKEAGADKRACQLNAIMAFNEC